MEKNIRKSWNRIIPTSLGITIGGIHFTFPGYNANFETIEGIIDFATNLLNWIIALSAVIAVGLIIYSGILFMMAGGDPDKAGKARKTLTAAVIGMAVVFIARMLIVFLITAFLT